MTPPDDDSKPTGAKPPSTTSDEPSDSRVPEYPLRSKHRTPRSGVPVPEPSDEVPDYPFTSKRKPAQTDEGSTSDPQPTSETVPDYPFTSKPRPKHPRISTAPTEAGDVSRSATGALSGTGSAAASGSLVVEPNPDSSTDRPAHATSGRQTTRSAQQTAGSAPPTSSGQALTAKSGTVASPKDDVNPADTIELDASELNEADVADDPKFPDPIAFGGPTFGASASSAVASGAQLAAGRAGSSRPTRAAQPASSDDAILPSSYHGTELADAVGAPTRRRSKRRNTNDGDGRTRGGRTLAIIAIAIVVALIITVSLLGRENAEWFFVECTANTISPEQGRSFPPWGSKPMQGAEWKPITLPPNAECKPRKTDNRSELAGWYLELLVDRASSTLTRKNLLDAVPGAGSTKANPLDVAAEQLNQALLLSRAPDRRDQRKEVERLLGDVQYWRATLRLRDASAALADAARQFETASAQRPRHVTDAAAWSTFLQRILGDLRAGPSGVAPVTAAGPADPQAPMGSALPPEAPAQDSESTPTEAAPDAGVPTGGVLL